MATSTPRGLLIALEGLDRSGKSSQCKLLCDHLRSTGSSAELLRFPNRETATGKLISSFLKSDTSLPDQSIHLCFSANRWESASHIEDLLSKGVHVILDRYVPSGIVYSISKQPSPFSLSWALAPDVGLPAPDLVLFLNVAEQIAEQRGGWGEEKYETREAQRRVRAAFKELEVVWSHNVCPWIEVDAGSNIEAVTSAIIDLVSPKLAESRPDQVFKIKPFDA